MTIFKVSNKVSEFFFKDELKAVEFVRKQPATTGFTILPVTVII